MEQTLNEPEAARLPNDLEAKFLEKLDPAYGVLPLNLGAPIALDDNRIMTTLQIADGAQAIAAQPDVPRNLTFLLTDANDSVSALVTIVGEDPAGRVITDAIQIAAGVNKAWLGTKIYAKVTSITVSGEAGAGVGDDWIVGVGNVIGLGVDIDGDAAIRHAYLGGVKLTPDAIATGVSTSGVDCNGGTYDGAVVLIVWVAIARRA